MQDYKLTQQQVANILGKSRSAIAKYNSYIKFR